MGKGRLGHAMTMRGMLAPWQGRFPRRLLIGRVGLLGTHGRRWGIRVQLVCLDPLGANQSQRVPKSKEQSSLRAPIGAALHGLQMTERLHHETRERACKGGSMSLMVRCRCLQTKTSGCQPG